jgi:hypothetical protein
MASASTSSVTAWTWIPECNSFSQSYVSVGESRNLNRINECHFQLAHGIPATEVTPTISTVEYER